MNQDLSFLEAYFQNPSWAATLVIIFVAILVFTYMIIRDKKNKKKTEDIATNQNKQTEKQQSLADSFDNLSDEVKLLVNNYTNKVSLMTAEQIISKTLLASKSVIKDEIQRIFENNHRENAQRQEIIKQSITNVTLSVYEDDIKFLSSLYYKSKQLSDFLFSIEIDSFFSDLVKLIFTTAGNPESEQKDIMMFLDNQFKMFILKGQKYYTNL